MPGNHTDSLCAYDTFYDMDGLINRYHVFLKYDWEEDLTI